MFLKCCKKILFVRTKIFALPYALALILLTILFRWIHVPASYLSDSHNVFNVYFMKYSYYYVIVFLLPFVVCLNLVYGFGNWGRTVVPLVRLVVNFAILFFLSFDFNIIGCLIGVCLADGGGKANATTSTGEDPIEGTCEFYGYNWKPFDISGHIYHNIYGTLVIMEEAQAYRLWELVELVIETVKHDKDGWKRIHKIIDEEIGLEKKVAVLKYHAKLALFLKINFCALAILWLALTVANLLTAVYFHSIVENVIAAVVALALWLLCYKVIFPLYGKQEDGLEAHQDLLETKREEEWEALNSAEHKSYNTL